MRELSEREVTIGFCARRTDDGRLFTVVRHNPSDKFWDLDSDKYWTTDRGLALLEQNDYRLQERVMNEAYRSPGFQFEIVPYADIKPAMPTHLEAGNTREAQHEQST